MPLSKEALVRGGGDDIGDTQLPPATKGDIFFTDMSSQWNLVGIYGCSKGIVESMPKDGVQYWSIYNEESYQSPVDTGNQSCILRVDTCSLNRTESADWAKSCERVGKPYDNDWSDNKSDWYYLNGIQKVMHTTVQSWFGRLIKKSVILI